MFSAEVAYSPLVFSARLEMRSRFITLQARHAVGFPLSPFRTNLPGVPSERS